MRSIADAGVDKEVESGTVVTLNGGNSKDPEGELLKYSWAQTTGSPVILGSKDKALRLLLQSRIQFLLIAFILSN